ncbi:hypothetical protein CEXT_409741 [Caerostris extrusa]|uniref:Secreted protein n=1 Tax=Caerostris extrusa TaxID=172846 RepID=A0AAV4SUQ8_CAEEX|nr:hypothetical protein CEXT_409741 [Caerostris extrusa]
MLLAKLLNVACASSSFCSPNGVYRVLMEREFLCIKMNGAKKFYSPSAFNASDRNCYLTSAEKVAFDVLLLAIFSPSVWVGNGVPVY